MNYQSFVLAGFILNWLLILINRFVVKIPNKIYLPLVVLAIGLMTFGGIFSIDTSLAERLNHKLNTFFK